MASTVCVAGDVELADELVEEQAAQALGRARVAGEQRALHDLGQVDQGEDRAVEVGEVPPEDVGLVGAELLGDVDASRAAQRTAARTRGPADARPASAAAISAAAGRRTAARRRGRAASGREPEVDDGHGHGLGAVEHRPVAVGAARRSRRTRGCGCGTPAGATAIIGWMRRHEVADVAHVGGADDSVLGRRGRPPCGRARRRWRRSGRSSGRLSTMSA